MLHEIVDWILATVNHWGYAGIFVMMAIESSFFPFPSEVALIPAGYLAYQGEMEPLPILLASILGSLAGAFFNYGFALWVGRPFLERYGSYLLIRPALLHRADAFLERHGAISTFTGRLIPGIRQLISLPAGLCRMNLLSFTLYTSLGVGIWSAVLIALGYFIGDNEALLKENLTLATIAALVCVGLILAVYAFWQRRKSDGTINQDTLNQDTLYQNTLNQDTNQ